jgi:zinc protease
MQKTGPSAENVQKVKEFMTKQHADELKKNDYMLNTLNNQYRFGVDFATNYEQYVDNLSVNSLKKFAKGLFSQGNRIEVSMSSGK